MERVKKHEGCRKTPYRDSEGILTVGYGRNLRDVPFSEDEVELMFTNDFKRARRGAWSFNVFHGLNPHRQGVMIEMVFQMGVEGVGKFKKFLAAAKDQDWTRAADEMLDSKWHKQTPERAEMLAKIFLKGVYER